MTGAAIGKYDATNRWNKKDMYTERDAMGHPFFHRRIAEVHDGLDYSTPFTIFDGERWDAMGRNYSSGYGAEGALQGALLGAAGTMIARDKRFRGPEPAPPRIPPRMPHPRIQGMGIHGGAAAAAA